MKKDVLLEATGLRKHFPVTRGLIRAQLVGSVKAVDGIDFAVQRGETFGLVGESGCGKTTTSRLILLLEKATAGSLRFQNQDVFTMTGSTLKSYRRAVQAVFQDPYSSLNPRMRVRNLVSEAVLAEEGLSRAEIGERVAECLTKVGLKGSHASLYPHEFSGGQRQRIAIARALAPGPELIVLDEPVSALDVSTRAQIMNLLKELQGGSEVTYLMIAHDLAVVKYMSDRIGVMYLGKLVETAGSEELFAQPLHPYTMSLLSSALPPHPRLIRNEIVLTGEVPSPLDPPTGCRFHTRCFRVNPICSESEPQLRPLADNHAVACHLYS